MCAGPRNIIMFALFIVDLYVYTNIHERARDVDAIGDTRVHAAHICEHWTYHRAQACVCVFSFGQCLTCKWQNDDEYFSPAIGWTIQLTASLAPFPASIPYENVLSFPHFLTLSMYALL